MASQISSHRHMDSTYLRRGYPEQENAARVAFAGRGGPAYSTGHDPLSLFLSVPCYSQKPAGRPASDLQAVTSTHCPRSPEYEVDPVRVFGQSASWVGKNRDAGQKLRSVCNW